jgi:deoxyribodipyrimidine photo-lyase
MRVLHWFRSDLRVADNTALAEAARRGERLGCCFVLDERLLRSERQGVARIAFLHASRAALQAELAEHGQACGAAIPPGSSPGWLPSSARSA